MKVKKIIIFTSDPFPYGMAATNRIISYAKGFNYHNRDVEVICMRRSEKEGDIIQNVETQGNYKGIKFKYLSKSTIKSNFFLLRRFHILKSYLSLLFYGLKRINGKTASIYYSSRTSPLMILWLANKLKRGILLKEESEHPNVRKKKYFTKILYKNIHFKLFDGYLLMTKKLILYFNLRTNTPILHVPMTVELDRFDYKIKRDVTPKTILYTGVLDDKKDGMNILLEAFSGVVENDNSYQLHLYGSTPSQRKLHKYFEQAKQLGISHLVYFKGRVSREVITEKLLDAYILVLPRPNSLQAQNGFPTKLGEYLATGIPTLVTSVGEIPNYLTDNVNSYIAKPGNVLSLKNKFLEIIDNYSKAKEVGLNGRKVAELHFNNIIQTKKILLFIENLTLNNK